ncbi:MAG TPA: biotin-dependent carboxyltransferase family protein [Hyphomicrobiaceae bacterium]|nr:biotin-dependent carboxyltransferase family protein [Hyphomicrobiaceae bacterium]
MSVLEILNCGPATTIQDGGRPGLSRIGLPSAGAMDQRALRLANALVGNPPHAGAVELAFAGLVARAIGGAMQLALAGAPADIECGGRAEQSHRTFILHEGEELRIGAMTNGIYAVLAIAGGIAVPPVLGSCSLDARAAIGGLVGRPLRPGDCLPLNGRATPFVSRWSNAVGLDPLVPIRVVVGPQDHAFTERGVQTLLGRPFTVSHGINRMAYRLQGSVIERKPGIELISDGTLPGSIQVPPDGYPIVLMADRQTIGGYPKIATVISADLGKLAQRCPGQEVCFAPVTAREAREIACQVGVSDLNVRQGVPPGLERYSSPDALDLEAIGNVADAVVDACDVTTWEIAAAAKVSRVGPRNKDA